MVSPLPGSDHKMMFSSVPVLMAAMEQDFSKRTEGSGIRNLNALSFKEATKNASVGKQLG